MPLELLPIAETYLVYFSETYKVVSGVTTVLTHSILYLSTDAGDLTLGDEFLCSHANLWRRVRLRPKHHRYAWQHT